MGKRNFMTKRKLQQDREAALEGLPLYMVILVVIAAVAMVVLLNWTQGAQDKDLDKIVVDPNEITDGYEARIVVTAYDTAGKKLEDVTVTLDGAGVAEMKKTNSRGEAVFNIIPDLLGDAYGEIDVHASYSGTIPIEVHDTIVVN